MSVFVAHFNQVRGNLLKGEGKRSKGFFNVSLCYPTPPLYPHPSPQGVYHGYQWGVGVGGG